MSDPALDLLTTSEVASILGLAPRTVRSLASRGRLPRVVLGHRSTRYRLADVVELIDVSIKTSEAPVVTRGSAENARGRRAMASRVDDAQAKSPQGRDEAFERSYLADAEGRGQGTPWAAAVLARLAAHDEDFGTSDRWASLTELCREVAEEGLDLGGWTVLIAESLDGRPELSPRQRDILRALLLRIARHGAQVHEITLEFGRIVAGEMKVSTS